jgi:hypothetical protein
MLLCADLWDEHAYTVRSEVYEFSEILYFVMVFITTLSVYQFIIIIIIFIITGLCIKLNFIQWAI